MKVFWQRGFLRDALLIAYGGLFMTGVHKASANEPYAALFVAGFACLLIVIIADAIANERTQRP